MSCGIYKIENLVNGKAYVGQSINIERRWSEHSSLKSPNSLLAKAFAEFGIENFSFQILEECPMELMNARERFYICELNTYLSGYNMTMGGAGSSGLEVKLTQEDVLKIHSLLKETNLTQLEIAKNFGVGNDTISEINHGRTRRIDFVNYPIRSFTKEKFYCPKCGNKKSKESKHCQECSKIESRMVERPQKEVLEKELRELNFVQVGKKYGVSDGAVRKWCKSYGMSAKAKDYK